MPLNPGKFATVLNLPLHEAVEDEVILMAGEGFTVTNTLAKLGRSDGVGGAPCHDEHGYGWAPMVKLETQEGTVILIEGTMVEDLVSALTKIKRSAESLDARAEEMANILNTYNAS